MADAQYLVGAEGAGRVVLSGCSGGGKSTLLAEMARRGWEAWPEPGRQIAQEQTLIGVPGVPWIDMARFAELALSRAMHFHAMARPDDRAALFDRGIVDAVTALERMGAALPHHARAAEVFRYAPRVFMLPPWEEIFHADDERRHGFAEAVREYEALLASYAVKGYETIIVAPNPIGTRAAFLVEALRS